jgi:hypothetical protein
LRSFAFICGPISSEIRNPKSEIDKMFNQDRTELRRTFAEAWRKAEAGEPLEPLEQQLASIIREHPEYHALLANPDAALDRDFPPEAGEGNPFLHLALHTAILEQIATDRPTGIRALYQRLVRRAGDAHAAEHRVLECLAAALWQAQRDNAPADEQAYLECLRRLTGSS